MLTKTWLSSTAVAHKLIKDVVWLFKMNFGILAVILQTNDR